MKKIVTYLLLFLTFAINSFSASTYTKPSIDATTATNIAKKVISNELAITTTNDLPSIDWGDIINSYVETDPLFANWLASNPFSNFEITGDLTVASNVTAATIALGTNAPISDWLEPKKLVDGTNVFELVGDEAFLNGRRMAEEPEVIHLYIGAQTYEYDAGQFAWKWDWTTNRYAPRRTIVFDDDVGDLPYIVFPPPYTPAVAQEILVRCGSNGMAVGFPDGPWAHAEGGAWFAYTYVPNENKWALSSWRIDINPPGIVDND